MGMLNMIAAMIAAAAEIQSFMYWLNGGSIWTI